MVDMITEFGPGPDVSDEDADALEPLWDIVAKVGTPRVFGDLTPDDIRDHISRLEALEVELQRRAV
jgi:hypothetical protein